jgi:hypothetical protein
MDRGARGAREKKPRSILSSHESGKIDWRRRFWSFSQWECVVVFDIKQGSLGKQAAAGCAKFQSPFLESQVSSPYSCQNFGFFQTISALHG